MKKKLGKLDEMNLREIWENENNFSDWLSEEENIEILSDELGFSINVNKREAKAGKYFIDILAEDDDGNPIIIENQLEKTNHDHLGKLITYSSAIVEKDRLFVIWIVKEAEEEHRNAIDWLNRITRITDSDSKYNFFLFKIEVLKIGNSEPAPKFEIISKPNNWVESIREENKKKPSKEGIKRIDFFNDFKDFYENKNNLKLNKVQPGTASSYTTIRLKKNVRISINIRSRENILRIGIHTPEEDFYNYLKENKQEEIKEKLNNNVVFDDGEKYSIRSKIAFDIDNYQEEEIFNKLASLLNIYISFNQYINFTDN